MDRDITEILYTEEQIQAHVRAVGAQIAQDYEGKDLVIISVLRGAAMFMTDLVRAIDIPLEMDFMAVSSYGSGTQSSGVVRILKDLSSDVAGRHVLIAEDIIDSGITLKYLLKNLASRGPASLEVAPMFEKEDVREADIECRYPGLAVPNAFVVGYGLDYAEHYRNLKYLGILDQKVYTCADKK